MFSAQATIGGSMKDFLKKFIGAVCLVSGIIIIAEVANTEGGSWLAGLGGFLVGLSYTLAWRKE